MLPVRCLAEALLAAMALSCSAPPKAQPQPVQQAEPVAEPTIKSVNPCRGEEIGGRDGLRHCFEWLHPLTVERGAPEMRCRGAVYPHALCEASNVWPFVPIWRVYYKGGDEVVDEERGLSAYLTLPVGYFTRFEMCATPDYCLSAWGGWFGGRALFHT